MVSASSPGEPDVLEGIPYGIPTLSDRETDALPRMNPTALFQLLPGPFNFLRLDPEELRRIVPDFERALPLPRPVYLEDESATPGYGFPILLSEKMETLRAALKALILTEEAVQLSIARRESHDRRAYNTAAERYRTLLSRALENATISNYGRQYPAIFWLYHSLDAARLLKDVPKRILRLDLENGRRHGDALKYRVFDRFLDRALSVNYDLAQRVSGATEEEEDELFPRILNHLRDNVLVFTEDHVSHDLSELSSYFQGYLKIDGRDLRQRLEELRRWHDEQLETDPDLRHIVVHLLKADWKAEGRDLLSRLGYVSFLATRPRYNPVRLLPPVLVQVWESLLVKLKEFELFHGLRRTLYPVERKDGHLVCRDVLSSRGSGRSATMRLSPVTRPLDFMEAWVIDPRVERFGMIYDISEFSQTVSVLNRSGTDSQDDAFRQMFRFQRRVNRFAQSRRIRLEKYLGDGAFYSSREALNLLLCSIHLQRFYTQALAEGFAFNRGLRIALNFGAYRLIPMGSGGPGQGERYEFFGHGLVELSRLATGKGTQEIGEIQNMLVTYGYPETAVHRFFAPLAQADLDIVDKREESRAFYAYIDRNGNLVNNGIVASGSYLAQLDEQLGSMPLQIGTDDERQYVVLHLEDGTERIPVGFRRLGVARLKGLEKAPVYEIVDGATFPPGLLRRTSGERLLPSVDRDFTVSMTRVKGGK